MNAESRLGQAGQPIFRGGLQVRCALPFNTSVNKIMLPVRIQRDLSARGGVAIKSTGADFGWSTVACDSPEHARQIMADYPSAAMPCWRNPTAAWNRASEGWLKPTEENS